MILAPFVLLLKLVSHVVVFGQHKCRHQSPFRDGRPMYAAGRRDDDVGVFDDWMIEIVVNAGGEEVNELETVFRSMVSHTVLRTVVTWWLDVDLLWCILRLRRQTGQRHKDGRCLEELCIHMISQWICNSRRIDTCSGVSRAIGHQMLEHDQLALHTYIDLSDPGLNRFTGILQTEVGDLDVWKAFANLVGDGLWFGIE